MQGVYSITPKAQPHAVASLLQELRQGRDPGTMSEGIHHVPALARPGKGKVSRTWLPPHPKLSLGAAGGEKSPARDGADNSRAQRRQQKGWAVRAGPNQAGSTCPRRGGKAHPGHPYKCDHRKDLQFLPLQDTC